MDKANKLKHSEIKRDDGVELETQLILRLPEVSIEKMKLHLLQKLFDVVQIGEPSVKLKDS